MKTKYILAIILPLSLLGCSPGRDFSTQYYHKNEKMLLSIQNRFKEAYSKKPFSLQFKDKRARYISYEILLDSFRYIYNFDLEGPGLADTLDKYGYDTPAIIEMIADMRSIGCTWISNLDYYENKTRKTMVFISLRDHRLRSFINSEKYYALAFFNEPQIFDERGRLTDKSERKKYREINGNKFWRITDRICYAITGNFR